MGVATVPSSAARSPFGLSTRFSARASLSKRVIVLAFKADKSKNIALVSPKESATLPVQTSKEKQKKLRRVIKPPERVQALAAAEAPSCTLDLDYYEAAAKLENIYKLSPPIVVPETEDKNPPVKRSRRRRKKIVDGDDKTENGTADKVVRSQRKTLERLSLQKRIELKNNKTVNIFASERKKKPSNDTDDEKINRLVREYSVSTDLVSVDWKKMKIPQVLPSSEHIWLFKLMQPMKAILPVKESVENDLGRVPTDSELAAAMNMNVVQLRKHLEVGRAARNKLIKHNLRLVLFVMNKYFQELTNGQKFQDFCQAGVKGLITGIDRFEPGRSFRLSTYGLFWIRHAIMRFMTLTSFTKVSFGLESVRLEIKKARMELLLELQRLPTENEIIKRLGITPERFNEVKKASRSVYSLHARHTTTQEEFINGVTDLDGGGDKRKQPALLRLALDDVLDSLKPKESLVIRQRYGLDGKGDRTLGEIAGNLNISREMVRKHEVKALMKLKHPARVDYLRRYIV